MRSFTLHLLTQVVGALGDWTLGVDGALHFYSGSALTALNTDGSVKWTFDAPCEGNATWLLHKEGLKGVVHVVAQQGSTTTEPTIKTHYALDGTDGSILWQSTSNLTRWNYPHDCSLLSTDSSIFFVCDGVAETIAVADGAKKWTKDFSETGGLDRRVHVGPHGGLLGLVWDRSTYSKSLVALQPENGSVKWSLKVDDGSRDWDIDGWASSVDGWAHSPGSVFATPHTPCDDPDPQVRPAKPTKLDLLFVNGTDGHIQTNRSYNVAPEWTPRSFPNKCFMASPVVPILGSNGEVWVPFLSDENGVCKHRAFDRAGITYRTLPCFKFEKTTRKKEDGTVEDLFVTSHQNAWNDPTNVLVYSGTTGQLLWNASIADLSFETHNLGFGPNGTIFGFDFHRGMLVAIRNGNEAWRAHGISALMAEDGTTYISVSFNGTVVAVDLNGKQKWRWSRAMMDPTVGSVLESSIAVV